ncbi:MAG: nucleotidyltransferase domain-containing protein [Thermoanaerobaculia bacterium]
MTEPNAAFPEWILPVGTHVVTRIEIRDLRGELLCPAGAVGKVVRAPVDSTHAYRVLLPNGREISLQRQNLSVRKLVQREDLERARPEDLDHGLWDRVIYRCVVGSMAYGLAKEGSDIDRRGFYLPPAELHWSLFDLPEQLENKETEECYWEIRKFITMALKANPNVLECLYTPIVEHSTPLADELIAGRSAFLSKLIYQTYNGYVMSQFKKLEQDVRTTGAPRWKHAMHLIRLLLAGITALREGTIPVRVEEHRDRLLAIKRGDTSWQEVDAWRLALHEDFERAFAATALPDRPDYAWANRFLVKARRSAV